MPELKEVPSKRANAVELPRRVATTNQLLDLLDHIFDACGADRTRIDAGAYWSARLQSPEHPLSHDRPDEPLITWMEQGHLGRLEGKRVLDVGAGNGRNAIWLADHGARVVAVDIAADLLKDYAYHDSIEVVHADFVRGDILSGEFDFIYDSGCFHHLPPHRRGTYIDRVSQLLEGACGIFGIAAFASETIDVPGDDEAIRHPERFNGYTFSRIELPLIFNHLKALDVRPFRSDIDGTFGPDYLNAALFGSVHPGQTTPPSESNPNNSRP